MKSGGGPAAAPVGLPLPPEEDGPATDEEPGGPLNCAAIFAAAAAAGGQEEVRVRQLDSCFAQLRSSPLRSSFGRSHALNESKQYSPAAAASAAPPPPAAGLSQRDIIQRAVAWRSLSFRLALALPPALQVCDLACSFV